MTVVLSLTLPETKIKPPAIEGQPKPSPIPLLVQSSFGPFSGHFFSRPVSSEILSPLGPWNRGQYGIDGSAAAGPGLVGGASVLLVGGTVALVFGFSQAMPENVNSTTPINAQFCHRDIFTAPVSDCHLADRCSLQSSKISRFMGYSTSNSPVVQEAPSTGWRVSNSQSNEGG